MDQFANVPSPTAHPVLAPEPIQLARINEYRDEVSKRAQQARDAARTLNDIWTHANTSPSSIEEADAVELELLRALMSSTRPSPIHLSSR